MRQTRVYTGQGLSPFSHVELTGQAGHYLSRVLRLSKGSPVTLFNGDGLDYFGEIIHIQRQCVTVKLGKGEDPCNESALSITLVQAVSRGERMDYSLQKATELGVSGIQLLNSSRVEVRLNEVRLQKRLAHWRAVITSACEQSGRARVPELKAPLSLQQWLTLDDMTSRLILDPQAKSSLSSTPIGDRGVSILVGPEGGFSHEEVKQVMDAGVTSVSLGPRVLRTETAGPAAIAILQAICGDFK